MLPAPAHVFEQALRSLWPCSGLQSLTLSFNAIHCFGDHLCLSGLTGLTHLDLSHAQLTALPALAHLQRLRVLHLSGNKLGALPEALGALSALEALHAPGNDLRSLPEGGVGGGLFFSGFSRAYYAARGVQDTGRGGGRAAASWSIVLCSCDQCIGHWAAHRVVCCPPPPPPPPTT